MDPDNANEAKEGQQFRWIHSGSSNPNSKHQERDGQIFEVGGPEWEEMQTYKYCQCTYEIIEENEGGNSNRSGSRTTKKPNSNNSSVPTPIKKPSNL